MKSADYINIFICGKQTDGEREREIERERERKAVSRAVCL